MADQNAVRSTTAPTKRLASGAALFGLAVMQLANLRMGLDGRPAIISLFLIGFAALTVLTLPWLLRPRLRTPWGNAVLSSILLLLSWALWSAWRTPLPRMFTPPVQVGRIHLVVPVVTAMVTTTAAWGLAAAVGARLRTEVLWRCSMLLAASTLIAGPRTMLSTHTLRLGTGMGGAAIYHVVLLLAGAVLLAAFLRGDRSRWSLAGAVICLLGVVLTGSRAGLLTLLVFLGALGGVLVLRGRSRIVLTILVGLAVLLVTAMWLVPPLRRLMEPREQFRMANYETALRTWQESSHNLWLGVGSGRMWPWYYFESGAAPVPWRGVIQTGFGRSLTNPHSLYLGVLAELGLVGAALLAVLVAGVLWHVVLAWRTISKVGWGASGAGLGEALSTLVVPLALASSLVAFGLDHYLLKNFAVSFWWWFVLASTWGLRSAAPDSSRRSMEVAQ